MIVNNTSSRERHCSLCNTPGHNSSNCTIFPIEDLYNRLLQTCVDDMRFNNIHEGLNYFIPHRHFSNMIQNLNLSHIKALSRYFGFKISYNRSILTERIISIYFRLAFNILSNDPTYHRQMIERERLLQEQQNDERLINIIHIAMENLQNNMNQLSNEELRNYISQIGVYIHFISNGLDIPLPTVMRKTQNKFNISILKDDYNSETDETFYCPICMEHISSDLKVNTNCNHSFCGTCISNYILSCSEQNNPPICSICRCETRSYHVHKETNMYNLTNLLDEL